MRDFGFFILDGQRGVGESCAVSDAGPHARRRSAEEPGFDEVLDRLRVVVERLEGGKLSLEESLAAYEEGVSLARRGHALLDSAEKRVEVLVRAGSSGVEVAPFAVPDDPGGDAPPGNGRDGEQEADDENGS
jgi:exodeoxyribonuclease VII small subunit